MSNTIRQRQWKAVEKRYLKPRLRRIRERIAARLYGHDLMKLYAIFRAPTANENERWYVPHYARHFEPLRRKRLNILEIGVGGYDDPRYGGHGLRMWKAYFPRSTIYGIDLHDKRPLQEKRIRMFQGRQEDEAFLRRVASEIGRIDLVIDDGSHVNAHAIKTFEVLFPLLPDGGIYVVEDTQTSYWPGLGGSSTELNRPTTIMGFFKPLVDGLNHAEFIRPGYVPSYWDQHVTAMHFYPNLVFIVKGRNAQGSTFIKHNATDAEWILREPVAS